MQEALDKAGYEKFKNYNTVILIKHDDDIVAAGGTSEKWRYSFNDGIGKAVVDDTGTYSWWTSILGVPIKVWQEDHHGQWAHEIGHAQFGFNDDAAKTRYNLMGLGKNDPPAPIISFNKVKWWLEYEPININDEKNIKLAENLDPSIDKIYRHETSDGTLAKYYIFEGREIENTKTILISRQEQILDNNNNKIWKSEMTIGPLGNEYKDEVCGVKFTTTLVNNNLKLKVSKLPLPKSKILYNANFKTANSNNKVMSETIPQETSFDIDLHVSTFDSRKVGMDYSTGEYLNEIDGASSSGNILGAASEWILISDNIKTYSYIDLTPAKKWAEEHGVELSDIEVYWQVIHFDENGNRRESEMMTISIDPENVDGPYFMTLPINITFLPPITTMDQFSLIDGSTLPIKFTAKNSTTDEFIYDDTVNVTITNSTGHLITYFTNGTGTDSVRINTEEEQYIANFSTRDYDLTVGETYTVTVTFGEDSLRGYDITYFTLIEGGKKKGKDS